jgi:fructokinase
VKRSPAGRLVGAVEAGGTKTVCAVGTSPTDLERAVFPTGGDPASLLREVGGWLRQKQTDRGSLAAIGVGSFGPVDLDPQSATYGRITSTPKPGWADADIVGSIRRSFPGIPVAFDTDVNMAALGENRWGAAMGLQDFIYVTIGTGVGGGALVDGRLVHGLVHPEMGHMLLPRFPRDDFRGSCPYHGGCWEGLCSGPALAARSGLEPEAIPAEHEAWDFTIRYTAVALANLACVLSPRRVILGGGVCKAGELGPAAFLSGVREHLRAALNGYIESPLLKDEIDRFVVPPGLGDDSGVCGAMAAAQAALGD